MYGVITPEKQGFWIDRLKVKYPSLQKLAKSFRERQDLSIELTVMIEEDMKLAEDFYGPSMGLTKEQKNFIYAAMEEDTDTPEKLRKGIESVSIFAREQVGAKTAANMIDGALATQWKGTDTDGSKMILPALVVGGVVIFALLRSK